jgi:hypothetical protein
MNLEPWRVAAKRQPHVPNPRVLTLTFARVRSRTIVKAEAPLACDARPQQPSLMPSGKASSSFQ